MLPAKLSRRAERLSTAFPAPHFPTELGPEVIAFDSGFAFPPVFPDLTEIAVRALNEHRADTLQYSTPQGEPALREWIAGYMNADGCSLDADHILVVNGAKHGVDLVCRLLLDEGDAVVVTAPTYFTIIPILRSFGAEIIEVDQDEQGLSVAHLDAVLSARAAEGKPAPKFIYNVTDFHNPTGLDMSLARRLALLCLAKRHGVYLVEDDPYRRVRFEGRDTPTLKALDKDDAVIHVATFSKLIAPGLRMGWIAAHPHLIARLMQLKSDGGANPLIQRIVLDFCSSPAFAEHTAKVQGVYREHRDRALAAVAREMPGTRVTAPHGGYYLWIGLPPEVDGDVLAAKAAEIGINILAGSRFFADADAYPNNARPGRDQVRLSFSFATDEQIDRGIGELGRVYRAMAS